MGAFRRDSAETLCTAMRRRWEASGLDEERLFASMPISLAQRTENDHHVPFDCH